LTSTASIVSVDQRADYQGTRPTGRKKKQKKAITALQGELAGYRAGALANEAEPHPRGRLLLKAIDGDAAALKTIASAIAATPDCAAVLVSTASPAMIVVARGADVPLSAHEIVTALTKQFGGRGGGKADLAQGGGLTSGPDELLRAARDLVRPLLD